MISVLKLNLEVARTSRHLLLNSHPAIQLDVASRQNHCMGLFGTGPGGPKVTKSDQASPAAQGLTSEWSPGSPPCTRGHKELMSYMGAQPPCWLLISCLITVSPYSHDGYPALSTLHHIFLVQYLPLRVYCASQ